MDLVLSGVRPFDIFGKASSTSVAALVRARAASAVARADW
jgi:hypothetical protein